MTADDTREALERLADAISGERRDWHTVAVHPDDVRAALAAARRDPEPDYGVLEPSDYPEREARRDPEPVASADAARCPVTDMPHDLMCVNCGHQAAIRGTEATADAAWEAVAADRQRIMDAVADLYSNGEHWLDTEFWVDGAAYIKLTALLSVVRDDDDGRPDGIRRAIGFGITDGPDDPPAIEAAIRGTEAGLDRETLSQMFATERGMVVMTFDAFMERLAEYRRASADSEPS